ncbi:PREDICTED: uncharacterized protein LOC105562496 [Vollenhovia emeryi]|uniref:uncharacterized protein LOC105562496 n=1 Tax=Vollenhovia emeryi TaxID=411798 RepID=UPI0005F38CA9|nr:PREDICTED: uncharacterized protein LOC105562496 [Vollenhovia emeryi]
MAEEGTGKQGIEQKDTTAKTIVKEKEEDALKQQTRTKNKLMEDNVEKILKIVRGMKDDNVGRNEIRKIVMEAVGEELRNLRQEIEQIKQAMSKMNKIQSNESRSASKSYAEATIKTRKTENILIVKPKEKQESETTKNTVLEKVKINMLPIGVSRMTKGNKGTIIIGCESGKEVEQLKTSMEATIGKDFETIIPKQKQPKIKIIGIDQEEMERDDQSLIETIKIQNELAERSERLHLRILKRGLMEKKNEGESRREAGSLILETDVETHTKLLNKGKVNIGWRKCKVYDFVSVMRCFKCWGFNHMAKHCRKEETCQHCAGNHKGNDCRTKKKKCINCLEKIKRYNNNNIKDDHEATDRECPTYLRKIEEEKNRRTDEGE